jgi:hypothetical protein
MSVDITTGGMQDNLWKQFSSLRSAGGTSLVSHMLRLQDCQVKRPRPFDDWQDFTCLSIRREESTSVSSKEHKKVLFRSMPSIADGDFVAISYRWRDTCQSGSYQITAGQGLKQKSSQVPDDIMDRVVKYVKHFDLSVFWIDRECKYASNEKNSFFQSSLLEHAPDPRQATIRIIGNLNVTRVLPFPSSQDVRLEISIYTTPDECAPSRIPTSYSHISPSTQLPKHTLNVITNTYLAP